MTFKYLSITALVFIFLSINYVIGGEYSNFLENPDVDLSESGIESLGNSNSYDFNRGEKDAREQRIVGKKNPYHLIVKRDGGKITHLTEVSFKDKMRPYTDDVNGIKAYIDNYVVSSTRFKGGDLLSRTTCKAFNGTTFFKFTVLPAVNKSLINPSCRTITHSRCKAIFRLEAKINKLKETCSNNYVKLIDFLNDENHQAIRNGDIEHLDSIYSTKKIWSPGMGAGAYYSSPYSRNAKIRSKIKKKKKGFKKGFMAPFDEFFQIKNDCEKFMNFFAKDSAGGDQSKEAGSVIEK
ncbi:MAG: hypothetical protein KAQ98_12340 [Bacteriovoracaceae bacterium]|nr:hypothetical protein [Bacteriovoracaceae bacterium]